MLWVRNSLLLVKLLDMKILGPFPCLLPIVTMCKLNKINNQPLYTVGSIQLIIAINTHRKTPKNRPPEVILAGIAKNHIVVNGIPTPNNNILIMPPPTIIFAKFITFKNFKNTILL